MENTDNNQQKNDEIKIKKGETTNEVVKKEEPKKIEEKSDEKKNEEEKKEEKKEDKNEEQNKEEKKDEKKEIKKEEINKEKKEDKKEEQNKEEKKDENKEEKKDEKKEEKKDEKKEEKKEEINKEKKEDKKEEEKEEEKDPENSGVLIKTKVDEKLGIKNMVEDKDLKSKGNTWDDLGIKPEIKKGLLEMDFVEPSAIQSISFPLIMKEPRLSVVAQAKNGSGKTGAFGIGIISSIDENSPNIQAVVLSHTRELNIQITDVLKKIAKFTKIKISCVLVGDEPEQYGQIIVTTPVHFENTFLKRNKKLLNNLKIMVIDEADEIIKNVNTGPAIKRAFIIFKKEKINVQILFFSATFDNACLKAIKDFYKTVYMIEVKKEELTLDNVTQLYEICKTPEDKINFIEEYLKISTGSQKVIIFVNSKKYVLKLRESLLKRGRKVYILMGGDMSRENRDETIERFRKGEIQILITTNLLARGYDERSIKLVINFDLPTKKLPNGDYEPDYENYLHRIGRTGRFGSKGIGLNLCCYKNDYVNLQKIEQFYKTKIEKMKSLDELIEQLKKFYLSD
jgi:ATP-dependent RNA helicase DDX19/DBP5